MKKSEIQIGCCYLAKVSGRLTTVRVDDIVPPCPPHEVGYHGTRYSVTNLATGRKLTFRSAAKFRRPINPVEVERYGIAGALANERQIQEANP